MVEIEYSYPVDSFWFYQIAVQINNQNLRSSPTHQSKGGKLSRERRLEARVSRIANKPTISKRFFFVSLLSECDVKIEPLLVQTFRKF